MRRATLSMLTTCLLLSACAGQPIQRKDGTNSVRPFSVKDLAKSDIDNVAEIHQQEILASLKTLTLKLYKRNPAEWRKSSASSAEAATDALFQALSHWHLSAQNTLNWETSLLDAWREGYTGDRVRALMGGLLTMHMAAFNHQTEFYRLSEIDAQKLYNAARNTEALVWKLSNAKNAHGEPLLWSNGIDANGVVNLSFEREFGKLIGIEDALAKVIEDKTNRAIRFGLVNAATMIFLPI